LIRLYILVEGQTEEEFVKHTLQPHLLHHGVDARVIVVATRRDRAGRKHRGGGRWSHWKRDLEVIARQQHAAVGCTVERLLVPRDEAMQALRW
jgi:hypothetical protein